MKQSHESSAKLTNWGHSLLNKLKSNTRNKRKRDAAKRRRVGSKKEIDHALNEK